MALFVLVSDNNRPSSLVFSMILHEFPLSGSCDVDLVYIVLET